VETFLNALPFASKTKLNILNTLKQFWQWAAKCHKIEPIDWPELGKVEMAFRKTVSLDVQEAIINNIKAHEPFRVWLCIKWLANYISIRPSEMLSIPEGDIDRVRGHLIVRDTKERNTKIVPLTDKDQALLKELPLAFNPAMPFFRHDGHRGHTKDGGRFSRKMIWAAWKRACARLGVEGVDLYGGTKHSTAVGVRELLGYEEVRKMTGHTTNKAFDRYIQLQGEALRGLYSRREAMLSPDKHLTNNLRHTQHS
jgi:integrase